MRTFIRFVAATQVVLIFPAVLFLTAVLVGAGGAPRYDSARVAQQIVVWYSAREWTLGLLLLALPFVVLITGCYTVLRSWRYDAELATISVPLATILVGAMTLTSAGILAVVALHIAAN